MFDVALSNGALSVSVHIRPCEFSALGRWVTMPVIRKPRRTADALFPEADCPQCSVPGIVMSQEWEAA
jgi:hypothetical protein